MISEYNPEQAIHQTKKIRRKPDLSEKTQVYTVADYFSTFTVRTLSSATLTTPFVVRMEYVAPRVMIAP